MELNRREIVLGGLAAVAAGAGGVTRRGRSLVLFRRHRCRQRRHLQDDQLRQDRQEVAQAGRQVQEQRAAGTVVVDTQPPFPLSDHREPDGDPLRRRRRPRGLPVVRPRQCRPQGAVAEMDAAARDDRAASRTAGLRRRRLAEEPARPARHVSASATAPTPATASTARSSPGASAPTPRAAASACSTRASSTSTSAARSAPPCRFCRTSPTRRRRPNERMSAAPMSRLHAASRAPACLAGAAGACRLLHDDQAGSAGTLPPNAGGQTNDPAAGFENVQPGSEEDFILNVGRRTYFAEGSAALDRHRQGHARQPDRLPEPSIRAGTPRCRALPTIRAATPRWSRCRPSAPTRS